MNTNQGLPLSLVITSYTTERLTDILELLESVNKQTLKDMETIFVVERSEELRDKINAFVADNSIHKIRVVFSSDKLGLSGARNLGIKHAQGEIIAFVDDDVVLYPDWADKMIKSFDNDSIIGVTGPGFPLWEDTSMNWLPEEFYWIISCSAFAGWNSERQVRSAWGMNMSFRREVFKQCLFSEDFGQTTGEKEAWKAGPVDDAEFSINIRLRTGKSILYNPQVRVQHKVYKYRLSRKFIRGQAYWQGYSKALLRRLHRRDVDTSKLIREKDLLKRILFSMVPKTIKGIFKNPKLTWKTLSLTTTVLFYVALGYSAAAFPLLVGFTKRYFSS